MPRAVPIAATAALAFAAVLVAGGPASAAYTPDSTMTFTAVAGSYEGDGAAMGGFCPAATASVSITSAPSAGVTIPAITYYGDGGGVPANEGLFETVGSYTVDPLVVAPGSDVVFTAQCLDAGAAVLASASSTVTTFTTGSTLSVPGTAQIGGTVTVSGTCLDPAGEHIGIVLEHTSLGAVANDNQSIPPGGWTSTLPIDAALGYAVGDILTVRATCSAPSTSTIQSVRLGTFALTAAAAAGPPTASGPRLADTGAESGAVVAIAVGLLAAGAALLVTARRRRPARS